MDSLECVCLHLRQGGEAGEPEVLGNNKCATAHFCLSVLWENRPCLEPLQ